MFNEVVRLHKEAVQAGILPDIAMEPSRFKKAMSKVKDAIVEPIKKLGQIIGTQLGWSKEVRDQIRRDVYGSIFSGVWSKMGLDLVGMDAALKRATAGDLGQFAELATSVIPSITSSISSDYATTVQGRAITALEDMTGRADDNFERGRALLEAKGILWSPATPEEAEAYAGRFAETEGTQFEGRYYFALKTILSDVQDKVKVLEADPAIAAAAARIAKKLGEHFGAALARPEIAAFVTGQGWSPAAVKAALMKAAAKKKLTPAEARMVNEVGKLIPEKPEEEPGWKAVVIPAALTALMFL
jgi:hypothetical protein